MGARIAAGNAVRSKAQSMRADDAGWGVRRRPGPLHSGQPTGAEAMMARPIDARG